jgi:hypothetical protein
MKCAYYPPLSGPWPAFQCELCKDAILAAHNPESHCCGHLCGVVMEAVVDQISCRMHGLLLSEDVVRAAYPIRT